METCQYCHNTYTSRGMSVHRNACRPLRAVQRQNALDEGRLDTTRRIISSSTDCWAYYCYRAAGLSDQKIAEMGFMLLD